MNLLPGKNRFHLIYKKDWKADEAEQQEDFRRKSNASYTEQRNNLINRRDTKKNTITEGNHS
jgi:hypothetical protein